MNRDTKAEIRYHREQLHAQLRTINLMLERMNDDLFLCLTEKPKPSAREIIDYLMEIESTRIDLQLELANASAHYRCITLLEEKGKKEEQPKPDQPKGETPQ